MFFDVNLHVASQMGRKTRGKQRFWDAKQGAHGCCSTVHLFEQIDQPLAKPEDFSLAPSLLAKTRSVHHSNLLNLLKDFLLEACGQL